jgi:hypothetical protein
VSLKVVLKAVCDSENCFKSQLGHIGTCDVSRVVLYIANRPMTVKESRN